MPNGGHVEPGEEDQGLYHGGVQAGTPTPPTLPDPQTYAQGEPFVRLHNGAHSITPRWVLWEDH